MSVGNIGARSVKYNCEYGPIIFSSVAPKIVTVEVPTAAAQCIIPKIRNCKKRECLLGISEQEVLNKIIDIIEEKNE